MKLLRQQQPPAMQSVYGEEKICAVVKVEDQNLFGLGFFFSPERNEMLLECPFLHRLGDIGHAALRKQKRKQRVVSCNWKQNENCCF